MFVAAISLQRACTLAWGRAASRDGARFVFSVIGLSRLSPASNTAVQSTPGLSAMATASRVDCRWWPKYGDTSLCSARTGGETARARLRLAYPLLQVALWLSIASLLLQVLRVPPLWQVQSAAPAVVFGLTVAGIVLAKRGAGEGLAALEGLALNFDAPGYRFAVAAACMGLASALLLVERARSRGASVKPHRAARVARTIAIVLSLVCLTTEGYPRSATRRQPGRAPRHRTARRRPSRFPAPSTRCAPILQRSPRYPSRCGTCWTCARDCSNRPPTPT